MAKRMRAARKIVAVPERDLVGPHPALCHARHPTYTLIPVCVPPVCSQPLHESLQVNEILHGVTERRPSECTRHALGLSLFSPPPPLPIDYVWEGSRHRLLEALTCALSTSRHPRVMRLADAAPDSDVMRRSWEQHLRVCERTTFAAVAPSTEGARHPGRQAFVGPGWSIQHDLEDDALAGNPVADFLRAHPHLKFSSSWLRIVAWLQVHAGPVVRRPAFINGVDAAPTTTHFDEYESVAFVLVGAKTFYVAAPDLVFQTGRGRQHESSANPFRPGSPREQAVPQPFLKIDVPAGCMPFLPPRWWHFVVGPAHTVMLCAWF